MTKKNKKKPDTVQSTLRLPRALHRQINSLAASTNLSMQQAVQQAIVEYCNRHKTDVDITPLLTTKAQKAFKKALKGFTAADKRKGGSHENR